MSADGATCPVPYSLDYALDSTANVWIRVGGRWVVTLAQQTASPHLYLTPAIVEGALSGGWTITHEPTGDRIPVAQVSDLPTLLRIVALVADLDWSSEDVGQADKPHPGRFVRAVDEALGLPARVEAA